MNKAIRTTRTSRRFTIGGFIAAALMLGATLTYQQLGNQPDNRAQQAFLQQLGNQPGYQQLGSQPGYQQLGYQPGYQQLSTQPAGSQPSAVLTPEQK